jgi:hypothetical protein
MRKISKLAVAALAAGYLMANGPVVFAQGEPAPGDSAPKAEKTEKSAKKHHGKKKKKDNM